jgi:hypothetical protein
VNAASLKVLRDDGVPEASGRGDGGRFCSIIPAIHRFGKFLEFDATTGCVMWRGGTTHGRGHSAPYGSFWDQGKRWFAHRWAARYIHGLNIYGYQVDHCCPNTGGRPNTLCVEHLQAVTIYEHVELEQRRNNIFIQVGPLEAEPLFEPSPGGPEFFLPPPWFARLRREIARPLESGPFREAAA